MRHAGFVLDAVISEAFAAATRVLVVRGSTFDPGHRASQEVLADVDDPSLLTELQSALIASPTDAALMTPGDPTIVILHDRTVLLMISCVQPDFIRLSAFSEGDARLSDPAMLQRWLARSMNHVQMSRDLDATEAGEMVAELLAAQRPPVDDEWIVTTVREYEWGWAFSWCNRRAAEGSTDVRDLYAGGGPYLIDRVTARVAMAGSAYPVDHYIELWRSGDWPDFNRPV